MTRTEANEADTKRGNEAFIFGIPAPSIAMLWYGFMMLLLRLLALNCPSNNATNKETSIYFHTYVSHKWEL